MRLFCKFRLMEKEDKELDSEILQIAEKIKTLRKEKGYTSYETFAFDYNINRVQYYRIEKGQNITLKTLIKVLKIHNLTIQDFFKDL
jgi:transcriptional regulator with XRE-family HTH domain